MAVDTSKYESKVNLKAIRRESESRVNASITRLGVDNSSGVDPYDNTPSFAKNKESRFKSQQTGYTNSLLEKILESQSNKDAWNATQEYHKKSLDYFEKIYSKLKQAIPDKKEQDEELEKVKARCSAITQAIMSGDTSSAGKLIWAGIKEAKTPWWLQTMLPMVDMIRQDPSMLVSMAVGQVRDTIVDNLPKAMATTINQMQKDLPAVIDAQLMRVFGDIADYNRKIQGRSNLPSDVLTILKTMGIDTAASGTSLSFTNKSKNYKAKAEFDRAFYETVTNGIPQQLARIEQALRGGELFYWEAGKGKFKRMDKGAYKGINDIHNSTNSMYKNAFSSLINEIVENDDLAGIGGRSGIRLKRDAKTGERLIDNNLVSDIIGMKFHQILIDDDFSRFIHSLTSKSDRTINNFLSAYLANDSYSTGRYNNYHRKDVEEADMISSTYLFNLFKNAKYNAAARETLLDISSNTREDMQSQIELLASVDNMQLDLEAAINSGATTLYGIGAGKRPGRKPKNLVSKTVASQYTKIDDDARKAENRAYSMARMLQTIENLKFDASRFSYDREMIESERAVMSLRDKFMAQSDAEKQDFLKYCIDERTGSIDSDKFTQKLIDLAGGKRGRLKGAEYYYNRKVSGGKDVKEEDINKKIAAKFKDVYSDSQKNTDYMEHIAKDGSNLVVQMLRNQESDFRKAGITMGVVTKVTKDFLKNNSPIKNPVIGTVLGGLLSAGVMVGTQTKYFKTLTGTDDEAWNSDGNVTNQQRVMNDLLVNKAAPVLVSLGVGKGIHKVMKKMGPIGQLVGVPAAIAMGVASFGGALWAKNQYGDDVVGEKDKKTGTRKAKTFIGRLGRDILGFTSMGRTILDKMDAEADEAEKMGMTRSEYRKAGKTLYGKDISGVKIDKNGKFTITAEVPNGSDKDGTVRYTSKSFNGNINSSSNLKQAKDKYKKAHDKYIGLYKQLTPDQLQVFRTLRISDKVKAGMTENEVLKLVPSDGALKETVKAAWRMESAELELDGVARQEAENAFDTLVNSTELKNADEGKRNELKEKYVERERKRFVIEEMYKLTHNGEARETATHKRALKGVKSLGKGVLFNMASKLTDSNFEILQGLGETMMDTFERDDDTVLKQAHEDAGSVKGIMGSDGKVKAEWDEQRKEFDERKEDETDKENKEHVSDIKMSPEDEFRAKSIDQVQLTNSMLYQIAGQLNRLFYESLPVYTRNPNMDDVINPLNNSNPLTLGEVSDLDKFRKLARTHVGYKASSNGYNKYTKDGRAYCSTGIRQTAIKALGEKRAQDVFGGTLDLGDPDNIRRYYQSHGMLSGVNNKPTEGDEVFFNTKHGMHMGIVDSVKGDHLRVQEYNAENGAVALKSYKWSELSKSKKYGGSARLNWNAASGATSNIASDLQPGVEAGIGDESPLATNMLVAHNISPEGMYMGMSNMIQHFNKQMPKKVDPIPVVIAADPTKIADIDNDEAARDFISSARRTINTFISDSETKMKLDGLVTSYSKLRNKSGVKAEHEQSERIEDVQESLLDKLRYNKGDGATGESGEGVYGLDEKAIEAITSNKDKDEKPKKKGLLRKTWDTVTGLAPVVLGGAGAYLGGRVWWNKLGGREHIYGLGKNVDDVISLGGRDGVGAEVDAEGNVIKDADPRTFNNGLHGLKDTARSVQLGKNLIWKGAKTGYKIGKKILSPIRHPVQTIQKLYKAIKNPKSVIENAGKTVKGLAGAISGGISKLCEFLAKYAGRIPFAGKYIKNILEKVSGKLGSFSNKIAEMLGKCTKDATAKAASEAKKGAAKKIPFLNIIIYGGLAISSFIDGYRHADEYVGLVTKGREKQEQKHKLSRGAKIWVGFLKALYDNIIGIAFAIAGSLLSTVIPGIASFGLSIMSVAMESIFHAKVPFSTILKTIGRLVLDENELKEMRLDNMGQLTDEAESNRLLNEATSEANQAEAEEAKEGELQPGESAGGDTSSQSNTAGYRAAIDNKKTDNQNSTSVYDKMDAYATNIRENYKAQNSTKTPWYSRLGNAVKSGVKTVLGIGTSVPQYTGTEYEGAVNSLIQTAESQIGYAEYGNNGNMYAGEVGADNNQPWCSTFQDWLFTKTFGKESASALLGGSANQPSVFGRAKKIMKIGGYTDLINTNIPTDQVDVQPGDLAFFKFSGASHNRPVNHIGLVTGVNGDGTVNTIEGNTTVKDGNQRMGGRVARKLRSYKPGAEIVGFGRPDWSQLGAKLKSASNTQTDADGKLRPGEQAGFMDTLGSIEKGIGAVHRGTRAAGNIKRSAEAMKRTMAYTKEANKGKSVWEKTKNNTRMAASMLGGVSSIASNVAHVTGNTKIGQMASGVAESMQMADRYARTASHQMDMVGNVITSVQTKTAGGIIDAVQTSGHILSSGFGGLIQGMDVNTRKLDQMCNTGDRTIRVLEEIKGILGKGNFLTDNAGIASVS